MLTKWGAALGLASAGRVVAGGGGLLGNATVWGQVPNWTALGGIPGPLRSGDLAVVNTLGPSGSFGVAQYNGTDWELYQSIFATVADLQAFGELIFFGSIAVVGTGQATDPAYYYDGAQWLRMPDGVHYVWQQRTNWADLSTVPAPQNNDRVAVQTLGTAHSSGVAERHGGTWKLVQGRFASVADMIAFPESVHPGAFAEVKAGGGHDDDSVTYVYQSGAWVRYAALTSGFAWTLSSLNDFSAVGLQDGDFGVYTAPAGGLSVVLRYKAAVTRAAGAGGGTVPAWLPPEVYAGTPTLQAYLVGNEVVSNDVTLNAQGWGVVTRTNGTITSQTTRVRLATTAANGDVKVSTLNSGFETTTKVYARALTRMAVGNGILGNITFCSPGAANNGASGIIPAFVSTNQAKGTFFWTGSTDASSGVDKASQATVAGLSSSDDMIEVIINTAGGLRACDMHRNGVLVSTTNLVASVVADRLIYQAGSFNTATQTATLDISQVQVYTW